MSDYTKRAIAAFVVLWLCLGGVLAAKWFNVIKRSPVVRPDGTLPPSPPTGKQDFNPSDDCKDCEPIQDWIK